MSQQDVTPVETLAERAHRVLRDRLVTLEIRPGQAMRDEQIGSELGVGRTPVREALKRLESERLVISYPRQGTFASEVNLQDLRRLGEVRQELEPLAARLAAERATEDERRSLRDLSSTILAKASRHRQSARSEHLVHADLALHRALYTLTRNPYLEDTLNYYGNLSTRIWCVFLADLPDMFSHVGEHREILDAICAGKATAAAELMLAHVTHFEDVVRKLL